MTITKQNDNSQGNPQLKYHIIFTNAGEIVVLSDFKVHVTSILSWICLKMRGEKKQLIFHQMVVE